MRREYGLRYNTNTLVIAINNFKPSKHKALQSKHKDNSIIPIMCLYTY